MFPRLKCVGSFRAVNLAGSESLDESKLRVDSTHCHVPRVDGTGPGFVLQEVSLHPFPIILNHILSIFAVSFWICWVNGFNSVMLDHFP